MEICFITLVFKKIKSIRGTSAAAMGIRELKDRFWPPSLFNSMQILFDILVFVISFSLKKFS